MEKTQRPVDGSPSAWWHRPRGGHSAGRISSSCAHWRPRSGRGAPCQYVRWCPDEVGKCFATLPHRCELLGQRVAPSAPPSPIQSLPRRSPTSRRRSPSIFLAARVVRIDDSGQRERVHHDTGRTFARPTVSRTARARTDGFWRRVGTQICAAVDRVVLLLPETSILMLGRPVRDARHVGEMRVHISVRTRRDGAPSLVGRDACSPDVRAGLRHGRTGWKMALERARRQHLVFARSGAGR